MNSVKEFTNWANTSGYKQVMHTSDEWYNMLQAFEAGRDSLLKSAREDRPHAGTATEADKRDFNHSNSHSQVTDPVDESCGFCNGRGHLYYPNSTVTACDCIVCNGSGRRKHLTTTECTCCMGIGRLQFTNHSGPREIVCKVCKGTGSKLCWPKCDCRGSDLCNQCSI